jgi:hypothetical protein
MYSVMLHLLHLTLHGKDVGRLTEMLGWVSMRVHCGLPMTVCSFHCQSRCLTAPSKCGAMASG